MFTTDELIARIRTKLASPIDIRKVQRAFFNNDQSEFLVAFALVIAEESGTLTPAPQGPSNQLISENEKSRLDRPPPPPPDNVLIKDGATKLPKRTDKY